MSTPRVEAVIDKVMAEHPGESASARAAYYEAVHQELAPLARQLEREIARRFDLIAHLERQRDFSLRTFGPGLRTDGLIDHIKKELKEIAANRYDVVEWVDVVLLALDGAWRAGYEPEEICGAIEKKLQLNETRNWPDWRTAAPDKAIEHVKKHGHRRRDGHPGQNEAAFQRGQGAEGCSGELNPRFQPATRGLKDV